MTREIVEANLVEVPPGTQVDDLCRSISTRPHTTKGGRVRCVPLATPAQQAALELAQQVVSSRDAHLGAPDRDLKPNLRRFDYVLEKFGITLRERGATGHGLRHERLNDAYEGLTGVPSTVRGGGSVSPELDRAAPRD